MVKSREKTGLTSWSAKFSHFQNGLSSTIRKSGSTLILQRKSCSLKGLLLQIYQNKTTEVHPSTSNSSIRAADPIKLFSKMLKLRLNSPFQLLKIVLSVDSAVQHARRRKFWTIETLEWQLRSLTSLHKRLETLSTLQLSASSDSRLYQPQAVQDQKLHSILDLLAQDKTIEIAELCIQHLPTMAKSVRKSTWSRTSQILQVENNQFKDSREHRLDHYQSRAMEVDLLSPQQPESRVAQMGATILCTQEKCTAIKWRLCCLNKEQKMVAIWEVLR